MKNKITHLNDHLFAQIERLSDEDLNPEQIQTEVKRGAAIVKVSDQIIKAAALALRAAELKSDYNNAANIKETAPMLEGKKTFTAIEGNKNA